ncbi:TadE/TadG family type IV pilus assembly protein [Aliidiomarina quisquiliarum]|uniref:TadE/TadG family type IV pilus assembly protein n=1 Tax=Aliidiomarina quisquiliarum TaxID=2938947 RepID=UPI00208F1D66|nr:TadE family protein [Aliidiomarina quisquiliarum]MCO4322018.1 pilus assembly protein [Aliidiomarina quisquiliarum]
MKAAMFARGSAGQSSVEAIVALPLFFFLAAAGVQLVWLLLAKHILLMATSYVALYAAVAPDDSTGQQLVFQQRIKPIQRGNLVVPNIKLITPAAELSRNVADYDAQTDNYTLDPAFASLQLGEHASNSIESAEQWLQLSNIQVQIEWCFRLQVPGMGAILEAAFNRGVFQGGTGCDIYNLLPGRYFIPLRAKANAPLHIKRQWRIEE